jgi:hypothetical protein
MSYAGLFDFYLEEQSMFKDVPKGTHANYTFKKQENGDLRIIVFGEIHEDWSVEIKSNFQNYGEAVGGISGMAQSLQDTIAKLRNAGTLAGGTTKIANDYTKLMVWKDTEPFTMNVKLTFETKTDPYRDVYVPTMLLLSRTTLTPIINSLDAKSADSMIVPGYFAGLNIRTLNSKGEAVAQNQAPGQQQTPNGPRPTESDNEKKLKEFLEGAGKGNAYGKLLNFFSVGYRNLTGDNTNTVNLGGSSSVGYVYKSFIDFKPAFISSVKPTFSKDRTTSGIPIRAELDVSVQSLFSANDSGLGLLTDNSVTFDSGGTSFGSVAANIFR